MHPWEKGHWLPGVLSKNHVKELIDGAYIDKVTNFLETADYSSIDLTLSDVGFRMICGSIKPCGAPAQPYKSFLNNEKYAEKLTMDAKGCFNLKASQCYVFYLKEILTPKLSGSNIYGMATAKSSV